MVFRLRSSASIVTVVSSDQWQSINSDQPSVTNVRNIDRSARLVCLSVRTGPVPPPDTSSVEALPGVFVRTRRLTAIRHELLQRGLGMTVHRIATMRR